MKYAQPIANIVLVGIVIFLLMKPEETKKPYYLQQMEESIERQDSLVSLINNLKSRKYEIKESIARIDSTYTDLSKDSLRARIRYNLSIRFRR